MTVPSVKQRNFARPAAHLPVVWLFAVFACFLLGQHHFYASVWEAERGAEMFASTAGTGNLASQVAYLGLAALACYSFFDSASTRLVPRGWLAAVMVGLVGISLCSVVWSASPGESVRRIAGLSIVCLISVAICRRLTLEQLVQWVFWSTLGFLAIGIFVELYLGTLKPWMPDYRFSGTLHPNGQGVVCTLLLIASLASVRRDRAARGYIAVAIASLLFLFLTKSRTAFGGALLAVFFYYLLCSANSYRVIVLLCMAGACGALAILLEANDVPILQELIDLGRGEKSASTLTGRVPLWNTLAKSIAERPWLGFGFGGFWTPDKILEISGPEGWGISAAHSTYLDVWLATGIFGLLLYVAATVGAIRASLQPVPILDRPRAFLGAALLFSSINGVTSSDGVVPTSFLLHVHILTFIALAFVRMPRRATASAAIFRRAVNWQRIPQP